MNLRLIKRILRAPGDYYVKFMLGREFRCQTSDPRGANERPFEYSFALNALSLSHYQDILDVGPGLSAWPSTLSVCGYHVTALDEMKTYWEGRIINRHFHTVHDDITAPKIKQKFGIITCISVLEHIPKHLEALSGMASLLKEDGIIILSFPYNENRYISNVYELPGAGYGQGSPFVTQVFNRSVIESWLQSTGLSLVQQRYLRCFTGEFWTFGQRLQPMEEVSSDQPHHLTGIVLRRVR